MSTVLGRFPGFVCFCNLSCLEVDWSCSGNLDVILSREARKDDWRSKQQAVKQDLLSQKLAAANAQEQAKMAMFHNMLPSGAKLTIPKRQ